MKKLLNDFWPPTCGLAPDDVEQVEQLGSGCFGAAFKIVKVHPELL